MRKPEQGVLTIWRLILVGATLLPALLNSIIFTVGGLVWLLITAAWVLSFLFFYLFYLPRRYHKLSYALRGDFLVVHSGVFYTRVRSMPLSSIQYTSLHISPLDALFGLCALIAVAPGGRLAVPGLRKKDAEALAASIHESAAL